MGNFSSRDIVRQQKGLPDISSQGRMSNYTNKRRLYGWHVGGAGESGSSHPGGEERAYP